MSAELISPILRSAQEIAAYLERSGAGLSSAEAQVLSYLARRGPCPIGDLHRVFGQKRSTLTSVLDRLADQGFIARSLRPEDRRSFKVALTSRGRRPAARLGAAVDRLEREILRRVRAGQVAGFQTLMAALEDVVRGALEGGLTR